MNKNRLIVFYSGSTSGSSLPERVLESNPPGIMLTYYEIHDGKGDTLKRFMRHKERTEDANRPRTTSKTTRKHSTRTKSKRNH